MCINENKVAHTCTHTHTHTYHRDHWPGRDGEIICSSRWPAAEIQVISSYMLDTHTHINFRQEVCMCVCVFLCMCGCISSLEVPVRLRLHVCVDFHSPIKLFKTLHHSKLRLLQVCAPSSRCVYAYMSVWIWLGITVLVLVVGDHKLRVPRSDADPENPGRNCETKGPPPSISHFLLQSNCNQANLRWQWTGGRL